MTYSPYAPVARYNLDTFEHEHTQFNYRVLDLYPGPKLYIDEQTSTVVADPFKFEEAML